MADDTTTAPLADDAAAPPAQEAPAPPEVDPEHWKSMSRKNERAFKAEKSAREKAEAELARLRDSSKSEDELQADRRAEVEREAAELRAENVRLRMAARYGIGEDDLDLLGSGDEDEIEARAKRVSELAAAAAGASATPAPAAAAQVGRRPTENLRPGATPADMPLNGDPIVDALKNRLGIP